MEKADKAIEGVVNHLMRARKGKQLLDEGRPLSEMNISITGQTDDEVKSRREAFLADLDTKNKKELKTMLELVENRIDHALKTDHQGTSELYWQRVVIKDKLGT